MYRKQSFAVAVAMLCTGLNIGCHDNPVEPEPGPSRLTIVSESELSGEVGMPVLPVPTVRVEDLHGNSLAGVTVRFLVQSGSGSVTNIVVTTDQSGVASPGAWILGPNAGAPNFLYARTDSASATFHATPHAAPASALERWPIEMQAAVVGRTVTPPFIRVIDRFGNGVVGAKVHFQIEGGGSIVAPEETNRDGYLQATAWTLGSTAGLNTVTATVEGLDTTAVLTAQGVRAETVSWYRLDSLIVGSDTYTPKQWEVSGTLGLTNDGFFFEDISHEPTSSQKPWVDHLSGVYKIEGNSIKFNVGMNKASIAGDRVLIERIDWDFEAAVSWLYRRFNPGPDGN